MKNKMDKGALDNLGEQCLFLELHFSLTISHVNYQKYFVDK